jgi:hypothetical protein
MTAILRPILQENARIAHEGSMTMPPKRRLADSKLDPLDREIVALFQAKLSTRKIAGIITTKHGIPVSHTNVHTWLHNRHPELMTEDSQAEAAAAAALPSSSAPAEAPPATVPVLPAPNDDAAALRAELARRIQACQALEQENAALRRELALCLEERDDPMKKPLQPVYTDLSYEDAWPERVPAQHDEHGRRSGRRILRRWVGLGLLGLMLLALCASSGSSPATLAMQTAAHVQQTVTGAMDTTLRQGHGLAVRTGDQLLHRFTHLSYLAYVLVAVVGGGLALGLGVYRTFFMALLIWLTATLFAHELYVPFAILSVVALRVCALNLGYARSYRHYRA